MFRSALLALALFSCAHAQTPRLLDVQPAQSGAAREGAVTATVALTSEGGFRWAKIERISISEKNGKYAVNIERIPYDGAKQGPVSVAITKEAYDSIVDVVTRNRALELKDDETKKGQVRDAPGYEISVSLKDKTNRFRVFAPQMLHNEYTHIVDAIEAQAEKSLPTPNL